MSRDLHERRFDRLGFPRVSGDEPWTIPAATASGQFSPRERG